MKAVQYRKGWVDQVEPGKPFRMIKGATVKDQVSRKTLREAGELYTPKEVAKILKLSDDTGAETVLDYIHKGDARGKKLGCYQVGRHYRVSEAHLEEFLKKG